MNQNTPHLPAGTMLGHGKYRIVRFIGAGGFGCTYEAEFPDMGIRVAIKEFYVNDFCDRDATGAVSIVSKSKAALIGKLREKFVREAQRLFKLKHLGIVSVTDILHENGTSYYVMDYIDGHSLQGPLPEAKALRYIGQVMDALEHVHAQNMLHLDIKPDNIMIDERADRAILIDFGVSKQYDEVDGHNTSTILGQTPGYAPAEQGDNSIQNFTPAADIYALGATLYTALTGEVPPSAAKLISGNARLAPLPPATSAAVKQAIIKMMQPDASNRPQTVAAARALLAAPAGTETEPANPAGPETPPVGPVPANSTAPVGTRHVASASAGTQRIPAPKPKKWLWAALVALAIAIGAAAYFLSGHKPAQEPTDAKTLSDSSVIVVPLNNFGDNSDYSDTLAEAVEEPTPAPAAPTSGYENGREWLDMGTGVKWATCNVGASSPTGRGTYFAWGETSPKAEYTSENSQTYGDGGIGSIAGRSGYDAARANWGGKWRMPTDKDFQELKDKCTWKWNDAGYYVVTAKNGNVLYLPAAGWQYGSSTDYVGSYGTYWSATPNGSYNAWYLSFRSGGQYVDSYYRDNGHSVRPVLE